MSIPTTPREKLVRRIHQWNAKYDRPIQVPAILEWIELAFEGESVEAARASEPVKWEQDGGLADMMRGALREAQGQQPAPSSPISAAVESEEVDWPNVTSSLWLSKEGEVFRCTLARDDHGRNLLMDTYGSTVGQELTNGATRTQRRGGWLLLGRLHETEAIYERWRRVTPESASEVEKLREELAEANERVDHWRVKATCYGNIVHGCTPALDAAGYIVDRSAKDGAVGGIKRAVEAMAADNAALREKLAGAERLTKEIHTLVWNLGGCDQLATSRTPCDDIDESLARPAVYAVNRLVRDFIAANARIAALESRCVELKDAMDRVAEISLGLDPGKREAYTLHAAVDGVRDMEVKICEYERLESQEPWQVKAWETALADVERRRMLDRNLDRVTAYTAVIDSFKSLAPQSAAVEKPERPPMLLAKCPHSDCRCSRWFVRSGRGWMHNMGPGWDHEFPSKWNMGSQLALSIDRDASDPEAARLYDADLASPAQ